MKTTVIISLGIVLSAAAMAQMDAPKPGPEQKKLDLFAGSWTLDGDLKATAMGPGGKISEDEKCEWMDGNFFLICHADFKSTMGNVSGVAVMGYSSDDKAYTYREFNSMGEFMESKGSVDGDTWVWTGDDKMNGMVMKGKFTMKFFSPNSYNFTYEMSPDGTKWINVMDGKAAKK
jgi:Protein of unknown function (DUF1579)